MDDAVMCFASLILVGMFVLGLFMLRWDSKDEGYKQGYRRGLCEGRGGVEVTVGDSVRCVQPPQDVRVK